MDRKQMKAKWKRYAGVDGSILVIAMKEERMQKIREGAERVKDMALFSTFDRLRNAQESWVDWYGKSSPL